MKINEKMRAEVAKILEDKNKAALKFQDSSMRKKVFDEVMSSSDTVDLNKIVKICGGDEGKALWQLRLINNKLAEFSGNSHSSYKNVTTASSNSSGEEPAVVTNKMKAYVPIKDGYISRNVYGTTDIKLMESAYMHRDNMLIIGDTGCGKTHLVRHIAYNLKVPYMRVNLNGATTPEDLVGQYIPNPNPGADSAKYVWQDGVLTEFMRNGGVFVVDEINMAPADILSMLHSVTDDERKLVLTQKDGEVIIAHKDFWFVATMNPDYEGTKPLNLALKDRFRVLILAYSDKVEKKLEIDEKFLELAKKLRTSTEILTPVSTRDLIKYRDDRTKYGEEVARAFFVNNFDSVEQPVVKELMEMILDGKDIATNSTDEVLQ